MCRPPPVSRGHINGMLIFVEFEDDVLTDVVVLEWHLVYPCTLNECSLILTRLPFPFFLFDFESTVTCVDNFIYRFLPHVTKRPSFRNVISFKTEALTQRARESVPSRARDCREMIIFKIKWMNYRF